MEKVVKNSLGYDSDLYVYQDKSMFNYSVDTILLGNFLTINSRVKNILEIGTNNGALSIFVSARSEKIKIDALEIQEKAIKLAEKNIKLNKKSDQINLIHGDFDDFYREHCKNQSQKYDAIVCNPPFYKVKASLKNKGSKEKLIATHELMLTLEEVISGSSKIIKQKGYLAIVEPTERLVDILVLMRKYNFEPKRIQMIHPREDQKSNLVLVEGRFQVGWGTHHLPNIYLHTLNKDEHAYREEVKELYKPMKVGGRNNAKK
ncbi:tRNA1(Val) (adenine(37)-N6)-methyltransferase [Mycoplasma marinum]|uniref:Lactate dehydrogenase n=1 Tax=Mycoplasma marinum TaxID=1937190 RepID=A0A4R0XVK2_9MOLU|nr:tRNA1(Val) (adenine(37)-N6)-methyltransferase [Mycoplasma marinum]TCG11792.1 lactate dehydrogenase [Mycoplasma marinum]